MFAQVQRNRGLKTDTCQMHVSHTIHYQTSHQNILDLIQFIAAYTNPYQDEPFQALIGPSVVKTIYSRLHLCWPPRHIAHSVLPPHGATMCNFNLQPLDFFGEFDPFGICQRFTLLVYIPYVQNFTHEFNHRLRLVKGRSRNCQQNVYAIYYS